MTKIVYGFNIDKFLLYLNQNQTNKMRPGGLSGGCETGHWPVCELRHGALWYSPHGVH